MNWSWFTSRDGRKWVYTVSVALIPLLVFYGVISKDAAPLWIALVGAIVAPVMALTHLSPPDGRGSLDVPDDLDHNVVLETED